MKSSAAVELLITQLKREGVPVGVLEFQFHPTRKWRFDLAYPNVLVAFEYEGGIFTGGAHVRGKHFKSDVEKYNTAALMGWRVFRLHCDMIYRGQRQLDDGWQLINQALKTYKKKVVK